MPGRHIEMKGLRLISIEEVMEMKMVVLMVFFLEVRVNT